MSRVLAPSRNLAFAQRRLAALSRHMASSPHSAASAANNPEEAPVLFRSDLSARTYVLNRPTKLNALDTSMLRLLKPKIEEWDKSPLCHLIIGTGNGRAFCAGGDVTSVVNNAASGHPEKAIQFFKEEFELDYALASLYKPYVALLDGITMGGGVGLSINALFRVATERTVFAMPETKIGYIPDVGASYFMSRLDGAVGTYLALTGAQVTGRAAFELGIATHYASSARIPSLVTRLTELENPSPEMINATLDEFYSERGAEEEASIFTGSIREAIDEIFSKDSIEEIVAGLEARHRKEGCSWAANTIQELGLRSPTSLRVALVAIRRGRQMDLREALKMELGIATAYCSGASSDFITGVRSVLVQKSRERPAWSPSTLEETSTDSIMRSFFDPNSPYLAKMPKGTFSWKGARNSRDPMKYALPMEKEIEALVRGSHKTSGGTACTVSDLITQLMAVRPKQGIEGKVKEIVRRKCEALEGGDLDNGYLRWKGGKSG